MSTTDERTLSDYVADWHPEPTAATDSLDPAQATRLAATLDLGDRFDVGDHLPVPWQWIYFSEWPPTGHLGTDGHPADGHFLPPIPDRRRMFAGSRITTVTPLRLGVETHRRQSVVGIEAKSGRSGDMLFVTVRSEYRQGDELAVVEEQDLVYRSDSGHSRPFQRPSADLPEASAQFSSEPTLTAAQLFRYSALTSNAHRIHYDLPYATRVEGYPDLVIHGPLLATFMAELARRHHSGVSLRHFDFRLQRPLFFGDRFRVEAHLADDARVEFRIVTGNDTVHVSGNGTF